MFSNPRTCIEAELRIFLSPRKLRRRLRRGIFPSPRAQEEAWARNFSKSQGPYKEEGFGIFPSPRDYMKAVLGIFLSPKAHINMGVPNPIILTYLFIFLHIFHIFLHILDINFFIFLAYSFLF